MNRATLCAGRCRAPSVSRKGARSWRPSAAFLIALLPTLAAAQPACPPFPEATSATIVYMPAGCVGPGEAFVASPLGYVARMQVAAPSSAQSARTMPPWAWAALAGSAAILTPLASCETGDVACETGGGAQLGLSGLAGGAALVLAMLLED